MKALPAVIIWFYLEVEIFDVLSLIDRINACGRERVDAREGPTIAPHSRGDDRVGLISYHEGEWNEITKTVLTDILFEAFQSACNQCPVGPSYRYV